MSAWNQFVQHFKIFLIFVRVRFQLEFGLYLSTVNCDIFGFCLAPLQLNHSTSASFEFPMISIKNFFAVDIKNYITSHFKKISLKHLIKQKVYLAVEKIFWFLEHTSSLSEPHTSLSWNTKDFKPWRTGGFNSDISVSEWHRNQESTTL